MFKRKLISSTACAALLAVPISIGSSTDGWAQLEEIVVTTRKREENLQDLPLAVTAIGFETLQRQGTSGLEDITKFSPSFIFDQNSAQKDVRVAVRGLSATRGRSNVAFLVDGIDVTSEAIGTAGASIMTSTRLLSDVQRVEAVKGPQSALYGRAAFAGAINYVTKDAPDEFEGYISTEIAEHEEYSVTGSVGGPIVADKLGFLANAFWWDEEGQYENSISGASLGGGDGWGGALTLNFDPNESLGLKLRLEYTDEKWNDQPRTRFAADKYLAAPDDLLRLQESTGAISPAQLASCLAGEVSGMCGTFVIDSYGDAGNAEPLLRSENPVTGEDYEGVTQEMFRASLVATWDIPGGTLTSYTGYTDSDVHEEYDWDSNASGRPDALIGQQTIDNDTDTEIFSQELRFQSDWDGPIQITLGANYWEQERVFGEFGLLGNADGDSPIGFNFGTWQEMFLFNINEGWNVRDPKIINDTHMSVYGMVEWEITEQFKATFENRYSEDEFEQELTIFDLPFGGGQFTDGGCSLDDVNIFASICISPNPTNVFSNFLLNGNGRFNVGTKSSFNTPKITLEWKPNDDILTYFSWAKAAKPAGMDVLGGGAPLGSQEEWVETFTFKPEKMTAYELGAKTNWSGGFGAISLNGSVFFQDYSDKQVSVRIVTADGTLNRRTTNAGAAEVWGLELESTWQTPIEGLNLSAAYTWLDTEYVEFFDFGNDTNGTSRIGNCQLWNPLDNAGAPLGVATTCRTSRKGNELERAPEHAFVAQAAYSRPLSNTNMSWFVEGDTQFQAERFVDTENQQSFDDYWLLNLRAGLEADNWEILAFVDNVTDDDTIRSGSQIPDFSETIGSLRGAPEFVDVGILPPKRQVGIRAKVKF